MQLPRFWCGVLLMFGHLVQAAVPGKPTANVDSFLDSISGIPTTYRTDLTLAVLEAQKPTQWKIYQALVESLYSRLGEVDSSPYPQIYAAGRYDTWERLRAGAFAFSSVDSLSLRLRIIRDMAQDDPDWARSSLEGLHPSPPNVTCSDALLPDLEGYYLTVAKVILPPDHSLSPADLIWLQEHIRQLYSPLQLGPLADLLTHLKTSREQLTILAAAYEAALNGAIASGRELPLLTDDSRVATSLAHLAAKLRTEGVPTATLIKSLKQFLENSLAVSSCLDPETNPKNVAARYQEVVRSAEVSVDSSAPVSPQGMDRPPTAGKASESVMPSEATSDKLLGSILALHQKGKEDETLRDELSKQAGRSANEVIALVDNADATLPSCRECVAFYQEKILLGAFDLLPDGPARQLLLHRIVEILGQDPAQETAPEAWMLQLQILLNLARPVAAPQRLQLDQMQQAGFVPFVPRSMQREIRVECENGSNPVISAYARADVLLNKTFDAPYLKK